MTTLIKNALVINEGKSQEQSVLIDGDIIKKIYNIDDDLPNADNIIDAKGLLLLPGIIDDQVHFREPGLTYKADIFSESRAAAAGGVTSFIEMPNTNPATITNDLLEEKFKIASNNSLVNYSFCLGATNDNVKEIINLDKSRVAAVKMFLGSSTGSLLVDEDKAIEEILEKSPIIVAAHCESNEIISENFNKFKQKYGEDIPIKYHCDIRSEDACFASSSKAVEIANRVNGHLHMFHLSTEKEISLLSDIPLTEKNITAEVCVHHLYFNNLDYDKYGSKIKWNPAVKKESDRLALIKALKDGKIDVVATDHAPHTLEEKDNVYSKAPSGGPLVQHSLQIMLDLSNKGYFEIKDMVKWMCHNPAILFKIHNRGFIRENYAADVVLVDPNKEFVVSKDNLLYKCGWSPIEGKKFSNTIAYTFVNGELVFSNGKIIETKSARALSFDR